MANPAHDQNRVMAKCGVLNTDGRTIVPIKYKESTGEMLTTTTDTISFTMTPIAPRDDNTYPTLLWEGTDGLTYPWVCNSAGRVLISF